MTIMMEREADLDNEDFEMELDEDTAGIDMDFSDLMEDGCDEDNHLDSYTLETGSCSITQGCDACGKTWTEYLD